MKLTTKHLKDMIRQVLKEDFSDAKKNYMTDFMTQGIEPEPQVDVKEEFKYAFEELDDYWWLEAIDNHAVSEEEKDAEMKSILQGYQVPQEHWSTIIKLVKAG